MNFDITLSVIQRQEFDCLILVHPQVSVLDNIIQSADSIGISSINLSASLSASLLGITMVERSRFTQRWVIESLISQQSGLTLYSYPDLLFEPSLNIDPLALFRQAAKINQSVFLWLGDIIENSLGYAVPDHHHYRTWNTKDIISLQPYTIIHKISAV